MYESIISSLAAVGSGGSKTISQCSKSHPSRRIVSFGGRLLQFGDESLRDDVVGRDENDRRLAAEAAEDRMRREEAEAATRGRRRWREGDRVAVRRGESFEIRVRPAIFL